MIRSARFAALGLAAFAGSSPAQQPAVRYLEDFEFLVQTVASRAAMPKWKGIDWENAAKTYRPLFAACKDDATHVRLSMELLAVLEDSHTGITSTRVKEGLPSKWDGLYGGGLWFGYDGGKWVLRGRMEGHALDPAIVPGSVLAAIGERPAWLALGAERARVARFQGISSDHSFFASLGNRLLPFGEQQQIACTFLLPDGKTKRVDVPRWGPLGKAFDFATARRPSGFTAADGAASHWLDPIGAKKIAYLAITGSMDEATVQAFHAAFDQLRGMDGLILDGRGMGGGGDPSAWAMNGRLFAKAVSNGSNGSIEPSGSWQFEGPLVYLMDELEVSSAETFTWGLLEHDRGLSIGRPTGGWSIIPSAFDAPSKLFSFRLGVNDRATPVRSVRTEGTGTLPDLLVPFGPVICKRGDFDRELAQAAMTCMQQGAALAEVRKAFHALGEGELGTFREFASKHAKAKDHADLAWIADVFLEDLRAEIDLEIELATGPEKLVPDARGVTRRAPRLIERANHAGEVARAKKLQQAAKALQKEAAAQEALWELARPFEADDKQRKAWSAKHRGTKTAALISS